MIFDSLLSYMVFYVYIEKVTVDLEVCQAAQIFFFRLVAISGC